MTQKKKSPGYRYTTFTAEQVEDWALSSAEFGVLKLDVDDFGAKLRVPQTRQALDEALAKLLVQATAPAESPGDANADKREAELEALRQALQAEAKRADDATQELQTWRDGEAEVPGTPQVAQYEDAIAELRQALSEATEKRKAAEEQAARIKTEAARGGNPIDTTVEGCFDNRKTGYREVWGQGKRDRAWPKRKVDQMAPRHGKPWGTYPDHPHNRAE